MLMLTVTALLAALERRSRAQQSLDEIGGAPSPQPLGTDSGTSTDAAGTTPVGGDQPAPTVGGRLVGHVNGYFSNRFAYQLIDPSVPIPTQDTPSLQEVFEANVQTRVDLGSPRHFLYLDLSLLYQAGWLFYTDDGYGNRVSVGDHDVPALHPLAVPSELYLSLTLKPWLNALVGRKRVVWGSGFAFNPTDLLNPPKDPTDPNYQRAGAWMARLEAPFEKFTLTGLFAPEALYVENGIPYAFLRYPSSPPANSIATDGKNHYALAGRLYVLADNSDVNFVYYFTNYYHNDFAAKSRYGASFSRYFFTDYEVHFEALLNTGSARLYPSHDCATAAASCDATTAFTPSKLHDSTLFPTFVVGTRRQFANDSLASLEYYYQGDGYSDSEFGDALTLISQAKKSNPAALAALLQSGGGQGLPERASFQLLRRHYLIASYAVPRIKDDWTVSAVLIAGLGDLSAIFAPSVTWNVREWLTLALYGYVPVSRDAAANGTASEFSIVPYDFRVLFEARAFYGD